MAKRISAEEFDRIFDEGNEDIVDYLDLDKAVVSYPDLDTDLRRAPPARRRRSRRSHCCGFAGSA